MSHGSHLAGLLIGLLSRRLATGQPRLGQGRVFGHLPLRAGTSVPVTPLLPCPSSSFLLPNPGGAEAGRGGSKLEEQKDPHTLGHQGPGHQDQGPGHQSGLSRVEGVRVKTG